MTQPIIRCPLAHMQAVGMGNDLIVDCFRCRM